MLYRLTFHSASDVPGYAGFQGLLADYLRKRTRGFFADAVAKLTEEIRQRIELVEELPLNYIRTIAMLKRMLSTSDGAFGTEIGERMLVKTRPLEQPQSRHGAKLDCQMPRLACLAAASAARNGDRRSGRCFCR